MPPAPDAHGQKVLVLLYRRYPDRLLLFRRTGHTDLAWWPVTGHVDPQDADLLAAARREVEEETGYRPEAVWSFGRGVTFTQVRDGRERTFEEHAFAADVTGLGPVRLSGEHVAFAWFTLKSAEEVLPHPHQRVALQELKARLLQMRRADEEALAREAAAAGDAAPGAEKSA